MNYQISENMQKVKGSAIREIFKIIAKPDIISFAGGIPDPKLFPKEKIAEISSEIFLKNSDECFKYGITEGYAPLIEKVNARLANRGTYKDDNQTIITAGGNQGLDLAARAILNTGDSVIVEEPSFIGVLNSLRTFGANLIGVPVLSDGMDIDKVEKILSENNNVKVLYTIPTFQNPSGITMPTENRERLIEICKKHNVVIFEDNPYGELRYSGENVPTIKSLDKDNVVMYFGSFSKILSPGMRVGFVHGMPEIIGKMIVAKQVCDVHTGMINQMIVNKWLETCDVDRHIKECCKVYKHKCDLMLSEMDKKFPKSVKFTRPDGGIFIWCTMPEGCDANEAVKICVDKKVAFIPGPTFMTDINKKSNCFRLNFSTMPDEKIIEGIGILGEALNEIL